VPLSRRPLAPWSDPGSYRGRTAVGAEQGPRRRRYAYREGVRPGSPLRWGFDALVVALAAATEVELWVADVPGSKAYLVPGALLYTLPLLLRRRFPLLAPAFVFAVHTALSFADPQALGSLDTGLLSVMLAFWVMGACNQGQQAVAGLGLGLAMLAVVAHEDVRVSYGEAAQAAVLGSLTWLAALLLAGRARRIAHAEQRAARLEQNQEERARAAVADERARIARELHDVIAHSVSVMTVQAGAARLLLSGDPQRAVPPLLAVEETGRQALAEMRRLLGILRADADEPVLAPQPGLADVPRLAAAVREAGLPVELAVQGTHRPLPAGVELAAYRILQEALTNAIKHAGAARAQVTVRYAAEAVLLEVRDDGQAAYVDGQGHGLIGMRERAALYGGELAAGPLPTGGFAVRARLPIEPAPR
jgi:signal transduction histidine kinase